MRYRILGRTGREVSEIGFGAWGIGGSWWGPTDDDESVRALVRAMELGINFVDTAYVYGDGHSERLIARAIRESGRRPIVATKIPPRNEQWPADLRSAARDAFPPDWIAACTERSLKNLGTGTIDLQQFHVWTDTWLEETSWWEAIRRLKESRKIRFFGVSVNDCEPESVLKLVQSGLVDTVQVIYNLFEQAPAERLLPLCQDHGVGVIVRVPFDEGSLTGTFHPRMTFHPEDFRRDYFAGSRLEETCERVDQFRFLVRDEITSLAQAALKFCLSHPAVSTVIPGMRSVRHVEENAAASDGRLLRPEELARIKTLAWHRNFY